MDGSSGNRAAQRKCCTEGSLFSYFSGGALKKDSVQDQAEGGPVQGVRGRRESYPKFG